MEDKVKVPKNIIDEIVDQTLQKIQKKSEFDEDILNELENILNSGQIDPDSLILLLKGGS
ncbi:MAG: hypothetical protein QM396_03725 [Euryarchaeota archaeon]|nr:hypothetical protein [Euryarchaeota archaeon]